MRKALISIILLIVFNLPSVIQAQAKRALVIGIGTQEDPSWGKINGDKDVPYVLEILKDANYTQILTCVNQQATKNNIVLAFQKLEASCQTNDIVYIHFSGHGQQMKDTGNDESDELDECWIPYDAYRKPCMKDRGEKHLTDDEIYYLLTRIRKKVGNLGKILVVVDACHSGDATRGQGETVRGVMDIFETIKTFFNQPSDDKTKAINEKTEHWITLSACESHQLNIEMKEPSVGMLTYAIYQKVKNKGLTNNRTWFRDLKKIVNQHTKTRPQRPVMSGLISTYNITDILH